MNTYIYQYMTSSSIEDFMWALRKYVLVTPSLKVLTFAEQAKEVQDTLKGYQSWLNDIFGPIQTENGSLKSVAEFDNIVDLCNECYAEVKQLIQIMDKFEKPSFSDFNKCNLLKKFLYKKIEKGIAHCYNITVSSKPVGKEDFLREIKRVFFLD